MNVRHRSKRTIFIEEYPKISVADILYFVTDVRPQTNRGDTRRENNLRSKGGGGEEKRE